MVKWKKKRKVVRTDVGICKILDSTCGVYRVTETVFDSSELPVTHHAMIWRRYGTQWMWDFVGPKGLGVRHRSKAAAIKVCEKHDKQRR